MTQIENLPPDRRIHALGEVIRRCSARLSTEADKMQAEARDATDQRR